MILEKVIALYQAKAATRRTTGWPSGSRWGACSATLQMQQYPERYPAERLRPRGLMVFEEGDRIESWWSEVIEAVYPGRSGLTQSVFHLPIPLDQGDIDGLMVRGFRPPMPREEQGVPPEADAVPDHRLWGEVREGFRPSTIREEAKRVKVRMAADHRTGFVLDPAARVLYAPTIADRIILHPEAGLVCIEKKSMSTASFRRALLGNLGYTTRCQLAGLAQATGLPVCLLAYEKNASHLLEIHYSEKVARIRVQITKLNGQSEVFYVAKGSTLNEAGDAADLPGDAEWERAATWTPYEPALIEAIRERIKRVLLFDGDPAKLYREAGPSFACENCQGTGTQTLAKADGHPLKKAKACDECVGGVLAEAELEAMPCGYCSLPVASCWKGAGIRLELTTRPHLYIERAAFEASGLVFHPPEEAASQGAMRPIGRETHRGGERNSEAPTQLSTEIAGVAGAAETHAPESGAVITPTDRPEGRPGPADSGSAPAATVTPKQGALDW